MNFVRIGFAFLVACPIWGQGTVRLSGKITDVATGIPVENAIIRLSANGAGSAGQTAYSDAAGYYSFDDAAVGAAQVDVVAEGFVSLRATKSRMMFSFRFPRIILNITISF